MLRDASERGSVALRIGDIAFEIAAEPALFAILRKRYRGFFAKTVGAPGAARICIDARAGKVPATAAGPSSLPVVRLVHGESLLRVEGDCGAVLDLEAGRGAVESGDAVAAVDVLLRLSLSTCTVENGWVLFHAAAVALKSGGWALLLGHSGAGKSTAARTFGSFCDEWVLARPGVSGVEAASTPYWNGKPGGANCEAMICLGRSSQPRVDRLRGGEGIRALLPHVVRFVRREAADRALLCTLGNLVERVPVFRAQAVIGPGFAEWLRAEMGRLGLAPERGEKPA